MLDYNPKKAAHFEVRWWQAHHHGQKLRLAYFLLRHQMELFSVNFFVALKAVQFLVPAVHAHNYRKKEKAIQHVTEYYSFIKKYTHYTYQPQSVAEKEVEWWWIHDDLEHEKDKSSLTHAFANLYAELISRSQEQLMPSAEHRTQATIFHDRAEDQNTSIENVSLYWTKTEEQLEKFYSKLLEASR